MSNQPHAAYSHAQKKTAGPRDIEYAAFTEATRRLMAIDDHREGAKGDLKSLNEALHVNRMLWGALADDCAREDNALPPQTRAQIISLARWVSSHSSAVLRGKEDLSPLIDINRMIMKGLAGQTDDAPENASDT